MKITKSQLKQIVKEELKTVLLEVEDFDRVTMLPLTPKGLDACAKNGECRDRIVMMNRDPDVRAAAAKSDTLKLATAAWEKTHGLRDIERAAQEKAAWAKEQAKLSGAKKDPGAYSQVAQYGPDDVKNINDIETLQAMLKKFFTEGNYEAAAAAKQRIAQLTPVSGKTRAAEKAAEKDQSQAKKKTQDFVGQLNRGWAATQGPNEQKTQLRRIIKEELEGYYQKYPVTR